MARVALRSGGVKVVRTGAAVIDPKSPERERARVKQSVKRTVFAQVHLTVFLTFTGQMAHDRIDLMRHRR